MAQTIILQMKSAMDILTSEEAAQELHCSIDQIDALRRSGKLKMTKLSRGWTTTRKHLLELYDKYPGMDLGNEKKIRAGT